MRNRTFIAGLVLFAAGLGRAADVLDRVVATVNDHLILQSDWDDEVRYEAFMQDRELSAISPEYRKAALDRLVDEELVREQTPPAGATPPDATEIAAKLAQLKSDYVHEHPAQPWEALLQKYGLTDDDIRAQIELEINQLRIIEGHVGPSIQVSEGEISDYYNHKFVPVARRSGAQAETLQEAAPKIREILVQQKINDAIPAWLEGLRSQAQIRVVVPESAPPEQSQ